MMTREELIADFTNKAQDQGLHIDTLMDGPLKAKVAFVSEGPGETEVRTGLPMTGGTGRFLWDTVRQHGFHRANVYTTNVVKRQISLSRKGNERHAVHRPELNQWIGLLKWELEQLPNVEVVFALGNYAMEAVAEIYGGITQWRGSVVDGWIGKRPIKIVLSINPAYALREKKFEPIFGMDCHKLARVAGNTFTPHEVEELINPSYKQALDFIAKMKSDGKPTAWDIEVINMETACHGLANDPHLGMCINLRDIASNRYSCTEERAILEALDDLGNHVPIVAQNGNFDAYWCWFKDHLHMQPAWDTLLAHHTLYPQLPHSLAFLVSQYTNHPYYKDEGKYWKEGGDIDQFWRYNCKDVALTIAVQRREHRELKEQGLLDFYQNHVMRLQPHLTPATVHGVAVDVSLREKINEQCQADVDKLLANFHRLVEEATGDADYRPNPGSWQQMKELYFSRLKLKGRGQSTDENNRKHMLKEPANPPIAKELLTAVNVWAKEAKFFGTYVKSRLDDDHRMRCDYKQYGVSRAPGRLSSSKTMWGSGGNLQNQPPRARELFISDPDCCFIYFDLSQAEARAVAYFANIQVWKEQFERARLTGNYDCHRALASEMFKIPYDEVPKKDTYVGEDGKEHYTIRYVAKRCRHGLNYRMQQDRLAEVTGLPFHEARRAFALYHSLTPELRKWWAQEELTFRRTKELWTPLGRRLKIIQRIDDDVLESVVAFKPQSTVGDKVSQVWYQSEEDDRWDSTRARIALNIHDALIGIAKHDYAKTALAIMVEHAQKPIMIQDAWNRAPEPLIIPAEPKMSVPGPDGIHRWTTLKGVEL